MPIFSGLPFSRQRLVMVVEVQRLVVVLCRRSWRGWQTLRVADCALTNPDWGGEDLQLALRPLLASWKLPAGIPAVLVLPPHIAGIVDAGGGSESVGGLGRLPYPEAEIMSAHLSAADGKPSASLFWLHKDWLAEFQSVATALNFRLVELLARAQLFASLRNEQQLPQGPWGLLESDAGRLCLHLFSAGGVPVRSASIDRSGAAGRVLAEVYSGERPVAFILDVGAGVSELEPLLREQEVAMPACAAPPLEKMVQHILDAGLEGLWLPPTSGEIMRHFGVAAALLGGVGVLGVAGSMWHSSVLSEQEEAMRPQLKTLRAEAWVLSQREREACAASDVVRAVNGYAEGHNVLLPLGAIAQALPQGAYLTHYEADNRGIYLEGGGSPGDAVIAALSRLTWIGAVRDSAADGPVRSTEKPEFMVEARWRAVPSVPDSSSGVALHSGKADGGEK